MRKLLWGVAASALLVSFGAPVAAAEAPKTYAQVLSERNSSEPFAWFAKLFGATEPAALSFDSTRLSSVPAECRLAASQRLPSVFCSEADYLVSFEPTERAALQQLFGDRVLDVFELSTSTAVLRLGPSALRLAASAPWVLTIDPDQTVQLQTTQNNAPWSIDRLDQPALPLDGRFTSVDQGAGVKIYIMDTGVNSTHTDFSGRLASGYTFYTDGNGTNDCNGHGTHVAGSAAGTIHGSAKQATVIPVRVIDCDGTGSGRSVLNGLSWIAQNTFVGEPAVVNMSLGGAVNTTLDNEITNLSQQGLLFVVAAGNENQNACNSSPARVPLAITVAASDRNDSWPSNPVFSNFGSCVDVIAPGVAVRSAFIGGSNSTQILTGTSMAAGIVSGVAAIQMTRGHQSPSAIDSALKTVGVGDVITGVPFGTNNLLVQSTNFFPTNGGEAAGGTLTPPAQDGDDSVVEVPPISEPAPDTSFNVWTVRMRDSSGNLTNEAKMYAKNPIGEGKVQFYLNGREIAWIRAVDESDPKLRLVTEGPMAGIGYLVRTVTLMPGKNALEIFIENVRERRVIYTIR